MNIVIRILAAAALVIPCAIMPARADSWLPQVGGKGGAQYGERCPQGQILNGFELRAGDDIDAIRAVCVIPSSPTAANAPALTNGFGNGWHGGGGGSLRRLLCPPGTPAVVGVVAGYDGIDTISLDTIDIYCGQASTSASIGQYPSNMVHAPVQGCTHGPNLVVPTWNVSKTVFFGNGRCPNFTLGQQKCPAGEIGIGMHGHSGALVDALGLICGPAPTFVPPKRYVKAMGHTQTKTPLQRAAEGATVARDGNAASRAVIGHPTASFTAVKSADVRLTKPAATSANRKAIIIVGGQPQPKAKQPTIPERIHDYEDQHH
jgi:hypothetical protein